MWEQLTPEHFTGPWHLIAEACVVAWGKHKTNEPYIVQTAIFDMGLARRVPNTLVLDLYSEGEPLSDRGVEILIQRMRSDVARRNVAALAQRLAMVATDTSESFSLDVQAIAAELATTTDSDVGDPLYSTRTLSDLFDMEFEHNGEVVPGLFKQRSRVVLTGGEGRGKSELTFQIALGLACGMHPFDMNEMPAGRVLVVDAENEASQLQERLPGVS